jgi:hypothetical protein
MATATEPDVITLGAESVKRLTAAGSVSPAAVSPLSNVLRGGVSAEAAPSDADLASFTESIAIVARPQAYVRILMLTPDSEDGEVIGLLVRDGKGVSFALGEDVLHLGRAQELEALVASLVPALTHEGPLAGNEVWLWPSVVQMLTALWQDDPDPARALPRAGLVSKLTTPEFTRAEAEKFVQGVIGSGAVKADDDVLRIERGLQPWLASGRAMPRRSNTSRCPPRRRSSRPSKGRATTCCSWDPRPSACATTWWAARSCARTWAAARAGRTRCCTSRRLPPRTWRRPCARC